MKERYHIPYTLDAHFGDVKTKLITDTGIEPSLKIGLCVIR